jgi:hypothetical protein
MASQQQYDIDDFTSEILRVLRVEVKDANGVSHVIEPIDRANVNYALTEYEDTAATPMEYDIVGKKIFLYPAPNYNSTNGLTFYFNRTKNAFASTDTTKTLGIPSLFHKYICNYASLPHLIENGKGQKNDIMALIAQDERAIEDYFAYRLPRRTPTPIIFT